MSSGWLTCPSPLTRDISFVDSGLYETFNEEKVDSVNVPGKSLVENVGGLVCVPPVAICLTIESIYRI